jgi:sporulation protein YlmC with PRC-barrel domain
MFTKLAIALVSTTLLAGPAFAQSTMSKSDAPAANSAAHKDGWRASKLSGVDVYNEQNEKIGDISDVILDKSGKAAAVIIGVGGFLGMGEHLVSVPFDKVKWVNEPVRSNTASTTTDRPATNSDGTRADGARTTTGAATTTRASNDNWYPDHAMYSATKDQLKQMPEFKY